MNVNGIWERIREVADSAPDGPYRMVLLNKSECRKLLASTRPADPVPEFPGQAKPAAGQIMILAPLPAWMEDAPELRRKLQAYVDGDRSAVCVDGMSEEAAPVTTTTMCSADIGKIAHVLTQSAIDAQFTLEEVNAVSLQIGLESPHWTALEKQLAGYILHMLWRIQERAEPTPPQTSGGVCRKCKGFTTYTRQNSEKGLCAKCETEEKTETKPVAKDKGTGWGGMHDEPQSSSICRARQG